MKENSSCRTGSSFHQNGVKEASGILAIGTIHPRTRRRSRAAVFFFFVCTMISSERALGVSSCQAAWWCCAVHTMVLLGTASFAQGLLADDQGIQILHSANSDALKVCCTAYRPTCVKRTLGAIGWTRCGCGDTGMTAEYLWPIAQYSRRGRLPSI